ncbi:MAG: dihydrodipicolinate synthase family protein [Streptosporangiaceae bacterium]|nr:dihydrodipicolinate synthase family protein [Streptosporangiaceae bacterium]
MPLPPLTRQTFIGPWAGLPVAWDEHDEFDEQAMRADVARLAAHGAPGVYTGGTSGEFYAQTEDEFRAIATAIVDEAHAHGIPAMIGCTALGTKAALQRIGFAGSIGADAVQLAAPFWLPLADHEIVPFFIETATAAGPMPYSIYETRRSKISLTIDQHREIYAAAPNYLMVKANAETVGCTPQGCATLSEFVNVFVSEHLWAEFAEAGAIGCCSATIYANPVVVMDWFAHLVAKDVPALRQDVALYEKLYSWAFAAFAGRGFQDSAWDRLIGNATGFLSAGIRTRRPYSSANPKDLTRLREWLAAEAPEWMWSR